MPSWLVKGYGCLTILSLVGKGLWMSNHSEPVLVPLNVRLEEQSHGRVTEHPPSNNVPCHTCYKLKILILPLSVSR